MLVLASPPRTPDLDFNRPVVQAVVEAEYAGKREPTSAALSQFVFDQTFIPLEGGRHSFRLLKPLLLHINRDTMRFTVQDWGIEMDCADLGRLPREVARRFLRLLNQAENEALSESDQADLLRISDYVDFREFSVTRSSPRYMEGVLASNANFTIVQWHDGSRERLDKVVAQSLSEVNMGEHFSAFVKLGKEDKAEAIERVSLLPGPSEHEDWESWPKKSS